MADSQIEGEGTVTGDVVEFQGIDSLIIRETNFKADGRRITYYSKSEAGSSHD
ncbi:MAG: hypothetical protein M0019_07720 [Actinomycetota bacterium]|nr:hypothetical protein [Actinomycetota bacterium]